MCITYSQISLLGLLLKFVRMHPAAPLPGMFSPTSVFLGSLLNAMGIQQGVSRLALWWFW